MVANTHCRLPTWRRYTPACQPILPFLRGRSPRNTDEPRPIPLRLPALSPCRKRRQSAVARRACRSRGSVRSHLRSLRSLHSTAFRQDISKATHEVHTQGNGHLHWLQPLDGHTAGHRQRRPHRRTALRFCPRLRVSHLMQAENKEEITRPKTNIISSHRSHI